MEESRRKAIWYSFMLINAWSMCQRNRFEIGAVKWACTAESSTNPVYAARRGREPDLVFQTGNAGMCEIGCQLVRPSLIGKEPWLLTSSDA